MVRYKSVKSVIGNILRLRNHRWLKESCALWAQGTVAVSGRIYGVLWPNRCCGLRPQPPVATSGRKIPSVTSGKWLRNIWTNPITFCESYGGCKIFAGQSVSYSYHKTNAVLRVLWPKATTYRNISNTYKSPPYVYLSSNPNQMNIVVHGFPDQPI